MEQALLMLLADICQSGDILQNPDINLYDEGLLDSLGLADFLAEAEDRWNLEFYPTRFKREEIDTPRKLIARMLEQKEELF